MRRMRPGLDQPASSTPPAPAPPADVPHFPGTGAIPIARDQARRLLAATGGLGLQGRVILCFFGLLTLALGATVYVYVKHTREQVSDLMGEQARQMSAALALANERAVRLGKAEELGRIGRELIKSRNLVFVGFFDADGRTLAFSSRDADIDQKSTARPNLLSTSALMQARQSQSRLFGRYVETVAPVLSSEYGESKLVGYAAVGVSQEVEEARLHEITRVVVVIALLALALSVLVGWALVHRMFQPIRALEAATRRIVSGDLDARVDVARTDVIGRLARAFNEMVTWVKLQQRDLAAANRKLVEANRDLEAKVTQRTAQLETANARLSEEIAEKESFLRTVSHDLSAPLRNIDGMATMLLTRHRERLDEDVIRRLERIKSNVEHESSLIAELLELSRIKTRRQKIERVNVEALVRQVRDLFEEDLRSRGIELVIESPLPDVEGERARLRQVFQNLIDNAIKYMGPPQPDRPRQVRVGCLLRATEAEFFVSDTGIGIEADELNKVFQVFRRGKNAAAGAVAGKGVGLASVRSIIETYSGRIWAESTVGRGSTFRFTINGRHVPALSGGDPALPATSTIAPVTGPARAA